MGNNHISFHHIGGRSGDKIFPLPVKFGKDIVNVYYEADEDCIAQLQEMNKNGGSECRVLPYCLSDTCKSVPFNINYDPFTSSIYHMNPNYKSYYTFIGGVDYIISDVTKTVETRQLNTVSMDSIMKAGDIPLPDLISIDTQGSEYDILKGAEETIVNTLALVIESVFHPISERAIVFGDLVKLLSEQGFHFARLLSIDEASPFRGSIGLRGQGFHMSTDTLFLRKIETIDNDAMLYKLAFISIIFNQFEYGVACLRKAKGLVKTDDEPMYIRLLRELEEGIGKMQEAFPYTFADVYPSFEDSKARFTVGLIPKPIKLTQKYVHESIGTQGWTEAEMALNRFGLENQANLLRKNRMIQMRTILHGNI